MSNIHKDQSNALIMILQSTATILLSDVKAPDYDFYIIKGIDSSIIQLTVWKGDDDTTAWTLVGYDDRGMWFAIGDRPDLKPSWLTTSSSWRSDLPNEMESPIDWLMQVIKDSSK